MRNAFHHHDHVQCVLFCENNDNVICSFHLMIAKKAAAVTIFPQTSICSYVVILLNEMMVSVEQAAVQ